MRELKDRIRSAMEAMPTVLQADLARACGVKPSSVSDWLSGETKSLKGNSLAKAAAILKVNPLWLAEGKGPREVVVDDQGDDSRQDELLAIFRRLNSKGRDHLLSNARGFAAQAEFLGKNNNNDHKQTEKAA
jgi:transcriptional regulator with XRE-family HTH domain